MQNRQNPILKKSPTAQKQPRNVAPKIFIFLDAAAGTYISNRHEERREKQPLSWSSSVAVAFLFRLSFELGTPTARPELGLGYDP